MDELLKQFNLSSEEVAVYKALLTLGGSKVSVVAKVLGFKRTSTQEYMRSLTEKNFINCTKLGNKYLYQTEDPDKIRQIINERQFVVDRLIHDLKAKPIEEEWQVKSSTIEEVKSKIKKAKRKSSSISEFGNFTNGGAVVGESLVLLWSNNKQIPTIEISSKEIAQFHKDVLGIKQAVHN